MSKKGLPWFLHYYIVCVVLFLLATTTHGQTGNWNTITNNGIIHRHENSFVEVNGKFYLIGGRKLGLDKYVNIYNPATGTWSTSTKKPPIELHHFQGVAWNGKIYIIGAFTGNFPDETPAEKIYIYDPDSDSWSEGATIPADRRRGSAGAVAYNNKIFIVGGATNGHQGGNVAWLDEYNPATDTWKILTDAPHARDHFQAVVHGNYLYVAGGRLTSFSTGHLNDLVVTEVDVYNFSTGTWETYPNNLPTGRAGTASVVLGNELLVIGGEGPASSSLAHKETEAMNLSGKTWRTLAPLDTGRHATHAIVFNDKVYIAAGSKSKGGSGSSELVSMEEFSFEGSGSNELSFPSGLTFGQVKQNETDTKIITLVNSVGNENITISNIYLSDNVENSFSIEPGLLFPYVLPAGNSVTIHITFEPVTSGHKTSDLVIEHNGSNNPGSAFLQGEGVFDIMGRQDGIFSDISIYPNPVKEKITVSHTNKSFDWEIINLEGKKFAEGKLSSGSYSSTIDAGYLDQGIYLLILKTDSSSGSWILRKE